MSFILGDEEPPKTEPFRAMSIDIFNELDLDNLGRGPYNNFLQKLRDFPNCTYNYMASERFMRAKYQTIVSRKGYDVAIVKFHIQGSDSAHVLCYLYWEKDTVSETPHYLSMYSTLTSKDGEFRPIFAHYNDVFIKRLEMIRKVCSKYEEVLLDMFSDGLLKTEVYYTTDGPPPIYMENFIEDSRIVIDVLLAAIYRNQFSGSQVHDRKIIEKLLKVIKSNYDFPEIERVPGKEEFGEICQKLTPLSLYEVSNVHDITFSPWKEIFINHVATAMLLNGNGFAFPVFNNWTYIDNSGEIMFDNDEMLKKYRRSNRIKDANEYLAKAKKLASEDKEKINKYRLKIAEAELYAKEFLMLSDYVLLSTLEYVGYTVGTVAATETYKERYDLTIEKCDILLANLCMALAALHEKSIIHGDLHANNSTINRRLQRVMPDNSCNVFIVGEDLEENTYVLPIMELDSYVIDFSRSIIGKTLKLVEGEFDERYAANFYETQLGRILRIVEFYMPAVYRKHADDIARLYDERHQDLLDILCLIDYISAGVIYQKIYKMVVEKPGEDMEHKCLIRVGTEILFSEIFELIEGVEKDYKQARLNLFNRVLGKFCYSKCREELSNMKVAGVFNTMNPFKYWPKEYKDYPKWTRIFDEDHTGTLLTRKQLNVWWEDLQKNKKLKKEPYYIQEKAKRELYGNVVTKSSSSSEED